MKQREEDSSCSPMYKQAVLACVDLPGICRELSGPSRAFLSSFSVAQVVLDELLCLDFPPF